MRQGDAPKRRQGVKDLYNCIRASVLEGHIPNPQNSEAVGFKMQDEQGSEFHITLSGHWAEEVTETPWMLQKGDFVHLLGDQSMFDALATSRHVELSNERKNERLLIMHPDILLTGTMVSNSLSCRRYALLTYEFQQSGAASKPLVLGNIVHEALQAAMANQDFSDDFLKSVVEGLIMKNLVELWSIGVSEEEMTQDCMARMKGAKAWAEAYYGPMVKRTEEMMNSGNNNMNQNNMMNRNPYIANNKNKSNSNGKFPNGTPDGKPLIKRLVGNEQNVCSHKFAFKGKLDGLISVGLSNGITSTTSLEIKTGRQRIEHIGQITVYYLLLCDLVRLW
jgi:DNA replication ATP-dependent helicase Dna2